MWLDFSHDTKQNLKLIGDGLEDTLNALTQELQLHVVEIIGNEARRPNRASPGADETLNTFSRPAGVEGIVACQLLHNQPCLLHCRLHAGALAVWLRSPVPELPDCLVYHCQRALNER